MCTILKTCIGAVAKANLHGTFVTAYGPTCGSANIKRGVEPERATKQLGEVFVPERLK